MTDDQGYGDFGALGNPVLDTPHFDRLAEESARLTNFYVSPVCSPTRASLLTGRYAYRTRVVDTWRGRSMMEPDEVTVAEVLAAQGYATGIFGKWHLGDNFPLRPSEQGFQESFIHRGGGLGQPSEPIENNRRYTDPILFHNNTQVETEGYCTDLYFEASFEFIEESLAAGRPFFAYIAPNAPHSPYHDVPEALYQKYANRDLSPILEGHSQDADTVARVFAMIENIDANLGRLFEVLERHGIARDTLLLYLNDNGPNTRRFVGPFRGKKGEVHEGGIRSPLWLRWPERLEAGAFSDRIAAHIDVMPTILEATGAALPEGVALDGRSLLPLLTQAEVSWPDRELIIQAHRGDTPQAGHHMMIRNQRWKLLRASGFANERPDPAIPFELYDLQNDPGESQNLLLSEPEIAKELEARYHAWFAEVSSTRPDNYAPPRMHLGATQPELVLTWQNRRGNRNAYHWLLEVMDAGRYEIELRWKEPTEVEAILFQVGTQTIEQPAASQVERAVLGSLSLEAGPLDLGMQAAKGDLPYFVILRRLGD